MDIFHGFSVNDFSESGGDEESGRGGLARQEGSVTLLPQAGQ